MFFSATHNSRFLCIIFLFFFRILASAQSTPDYYNNKFQKLNTENGLPSNIILGEVQDKAGFIWIATSNGLVRFDGIRMKVFQNIISDSTSLPNNNIKDICIDSLGVIWMGTANGIVKFIPELEKFLDLHSDKSGRLKGLRGYYDNLYLDDKKRLSCSNSFNKEIVVINTETDSLLAVFNKETLGSQNWIPENKQLFFVDNNSFWFVAHDLLVVELGQVKTVSRRCNEFKNKSFNQPSNFTFAFLDSKGNVYCGNNGLLFLPRDKKHTFEFEYIDLFNGRKPSKINDFQVSGIVEDKEGNIWISTLYHGLKRYHPDTKKIENFNFRLVNYNNVLSTNAYFLKDKLNNIWIVHNNGVLQFYDYRTNSFIEYKHEPANQLSIPPDLYVETPSRKIFLDLSGNYWLPASGSGLMYFSLTNTKFPILKSIPGVANSLTSNAVWGIMEDNSGLLWLGTSGGVNIIDTQTGKIYNNLDNTDPLLGNINLCMAFVRTSRGEYWASSFPVRQFRYNRSTHSSELINEFRPDINDSTTIQGWGASYFLEDRKRDIWIANFEGLHLYNKPDDTHPKGYFTNYAEDSNSQTGIANNQVWHLMEDNKGRIWISTADGLSSLNAERSKITNYHHNPNDSLTLSNSGIKSTLQDSKGRIWIATEGGGLNRFIEDENRFIAFNKSNGFPSDNIFVVFEDKEGFLWMSSTDGVIKFNPETKSIYTFTPQDGLQSKQFVAGSFFQNKLTGKIYFGGLNGVNHFFPDSIKLSDFVPGIAFESLKVFNSEIGVGKEYHGKVILSKAIAYTDKITLSYLQNVFSIEFAAFDYSAAKNIRYSYMLEGANDNWIEADGENKILNFANLSPGDYTLKVKSTNADGVWCENMKTLIIIVTPPWWNSWWFRTVFLILVLTGIILVFRLRLKILKNRNIELEDKVKKRTFELEDANTLLEEKHEEILNQNEEIKASQEEIISQAEHLHHVDQQKLQFLTNISHEFRTPLSLILGPAEKLIEQETELAQAGKTSLYKMIQRNSLRMLRLVNQVLDISKVEAGEMSIQIVKSDLMQHIKPIFDSFSFVAERKNIRFNFRNNAETMTAYFDPDKVEKIIYNLLSNAFKFTNPGGRIDVNVEGSFVMENTNEAIEVVIKVSDSGIGIPKEQIKHIFDRFYQVKSNLVKGTGIGLALTRDLVALHKGSIEVNSILGKGTEFTVILPLSKEIFLNEETVIEPQFNKVDLLNMALLQSSEMDDDAGEESEILIDKKSKLPIILVVEDNYDMRKFLAIELNPEYQIIEASDGAKGIELALEKIPDLIITDLMMPFIDGLTLINTLKKDKHTSHIPVILLTAKVNEESRTEGYETGADSYISKPFKMPVLKARIKNLLQIQKTLRQRFSSEIEIEPKDIVLNSADEQLLNRAIYIIEQNSKDENFNVERLALDLGIHRVQLSRKFLALTNENISDFIRITRLKKAAKLLLSRDFSISEVCYQVGFKDPAHFTRIFCKQFNITPSKYIEENTKN